MLFCTIQQNVIYFYLKYISLQFFDMASKGIFFHAIALLSLSWCFFLGSRAYGCSLFWCAHQCTGFYIWYALLVHFMSIVPKLDFIWTCNVNTKIITHTERALWFFITKINFLCEGSSSYGGGGGDGGDGESYSPWHVALLILFTSIFVFLSAMCTAWYTTA